VAAYGTALFKAGLQSNALTQRVSMALKTTTGSAQAAQQQLAEIREFGKTSPIALPVWLKASQQMLAFGVEAGKVVPLLGAVQDAVVAAGGTEEEIKGVVRALSQMQSKGKLSAEELNQIGERGVDAAGVVAQAFGVTSQEIRAQITAGTLSVEDFFDGFVKGSKIAFGGAAQNAKQTFDGMIDRLKGAHRRIGELLVTPLINPEGGGALVELGNALADAMNNIEDAIRPLVDIMVRQLDPAVDKTAKSIREFGESITTDKILGFFDTIRGGLPVLSALSAMLTAKLASGFLELVPGMQRFAGAMSPVIFGVAALAATSPELRKALADLSIAVQPLIPVAAQLATTLASGLTSALKVVTPLVEIAADAVKLITDNLAKSIGVFAFVTAALYTMAAAQGVNTGATMLAAIGVGKLKDAFVALKTVVVAHPILAVAAVLVGLVAWANKADKASDELATTLTNEVVSAMGQASDATGEFNSSLVGTGDSLETLLERSQNTVKEFKGVVQGFDWGNFFKTPEGNVVKPIEIIPPDEKDVQNFLDATSAIDDHMAELARAGLDAEAVQKRMNDEFGITPGQLEAIKPQLDDYLAAQIELAEETQEVADKYGDATAALQGWGQELKAQTDPYFGLIKAQGDYNDALEKYNEILNDPEASANDRTQAALGLAEAMTGLRTAADEAGTALGEQLPPDFIAMAEAMNIPDSAIQELQDAFSAASTGIVESNDVMVATNAETAAKVAEQMGLMSGSVAEKAGMIATSLEQVADNHGDVDDAFYQLALRAGMTKDGVIEAMLEMRDAGFDFSTEIDEYLDAAGGSHTDMADKTQTAGERMAEYLAGIRGEDVATSEASDEMRRRTNANMDLTAENMAGNTQAMGITLDGFRDKLDAAWKKVKRVADAIKEKWGDLKGTTSAAWKSIQSSIGGPVGAILGFYNKGVKPMWNAISNAMFGGKGILPAIAMSGGSKGAGGSGKSKRRALGGGITGPGTSTSDSIPALLSNGEYVIRAAAVNKYGKGTFDALNGMTVGPQKFALGGFVSNIASTAMDKVMSGVEKFGGSVSGWFDIAESVGKLLSTSKSLLGGIKGDENSAKMASMLKSGGSKAVGRLTSLVDQFNAMGFGGEGGPGNYQAMAAWIKKAVPGTIITSGLRSGSGTSYHNVGKAIDMAFTDGSERRGGGIAKTAYNMIKRTWMNSILELIWDFSPDGRSRGVKNGRPHTFTGGSAGPGTHADHIHWANEGSGGKGVGGGGSGRWSDTVASVLRELGLYSSSHLNLVLKAIMKESSGNPNTVNTWDINAKNGTPSKGLLQTIDPTFYAWAGKYAGLGPFNPRANIYAAIRYAKNRYGSGWAARMARPGGYAEGGYVKPTLYDNGGLLPPGVSLVENRTGVPEPVGHDLKGGGDTYITINMPNAVISSKREFQGMVYDALDEMNRKGRVRNLNLKIK
jgi:tape measure domain-containing protein